MTRFIAYVAFTLFSLPAISGPIINGVEWYQPAAFTNLSWDDVNAVCPTDGTACTGALNGTDVTGGIWASVEDMNALFNWFIEEDKLGPGHDEYVDISGGDLASDFLAVFALTGSNNEGSFVIGWTSWLEGGDPSTTAIAEVLARAEGDIASTRRFGLTNESSNGTGAWLYRAPPAAVPAPATLALFGLGLAGLGWSRRKRA